MDTGASKKQNVQLSKWTENMHKRCKICEEICKKYTQIFIFEICTILQDICTITQHSIGMRNNNFDILCITMKSLAQDQLPDDNLHPGFYTESTVLIVKQCLITQKEWGTSECPCRHCRAAVRVRRPACQGK